MEEVKKVAFVHGEFPVGGAERVTCDIANELFKRGGMRYMYLRQGCILIYCLPIWQQTNIFIW